MKHMGAGLALSVLLHLAAGYLVIHGVEASRQLPAIREEPVEVTMVSPEELAEAEEEATREEAEQDAAEAEEAKEPEQADPAAEVQEEPQVLAAAPEPAPEPEQEPEPEPASEPAQEPEPEAALEAAAVETGPPEQAPQEEAAPEENASEAGVPEEAGQVAALPQAPETAEPARQDMRIFQPVTEFGEEDSGNRDLEGDSASEAAVSAQDEAIEDPAEHVGDGSPEVLDEAPDEAGDEPDLAEGEDTSQIAEAAEEPREPATEAPAVLGAGLADDDTDTLGVLQGEPRTSSGGVPREKPSDIVQLAARARIAPDADSEGGGSLSTARRLFSRRLSNDERVRVAMRGMPHAARADLLCMTELRGQLRIATPSYNPDILPSFRLREGSVLEPRRAAFRAAGQWYELSFRCELNPEVTRVERFSFRVGNPIPRSQWQARGFPLN
jgi:hypothetical protein